MKNLTRDDLAAAARYIDNPAKEQTLGVLFEHLSQVVSTNDLVYMAYQRALRAIMREDNIPVPGVKTRIPLTTQQHKRLRVYAAMWLDAATLILYLSVSPEDTEAISNGIMDTPSEGNTPV